MNSVRGALAFGLAIAMVAALDAQTVAFKIATVDRGRHPTDAQVQEWDGRLTRLKAKCTKETDVRIADMLVAGHRQLTERGGNRTLRDFAWMVDVGLSPGPLELLDCATVISTVVIRDLNKRDPLLKDPSAPKPSR